MTGSPFKLGLHAGRTRAGRNTCPFAAGTRAATVWQDWYGRGLLVPVGSGKSNSHPHCLQPTDCRAAGDGLCRSCFLKRKHADPEFQQRRDQRILLAKAAQLADPAKEAARRATSAAKIKEQWKDLAFRRARTAGVKKALADPEKRKKMLVAFVAAGRTPEAKAKARANIKKAQNPASRAKTKKTNQKSGRWMTPAQHRKIAAEVRDTTDSYEAIGARWGISGSYVHKIAVKHGVARPHR